MTRIAVGGGKGGRLTSGSWDVNTQSLAEHIYTYQYVTVLPLGHRPTLFANSPIDSAGAFARA